MNGDNASTRGERRQEKRRPRRKMGVSGKSFINAVRNAILKRKELVETKKG